jgi:hypothetical protein
MDKIKEYRKGMAAQYLDWFFMIMAIAILLKNWLWSPIDNYIFWFAFCVLASTIWETQSLIYKHIALGHEEQNGQGDTEETREDIPVQ